MTVSNKFLANDTAIANHVWLSLPAASRHHAMFGNVNSSSARRPKVSIVQTAGKANTKFTKPKPNEANRAVRFDAPAWLKTDEL